MEYNIKTSKKLTRKIVSIWEPGGTHDTGGGSKGVKICREGEGKVWGGRDM